MSQKNTEDKLLKEASAPILLNILAIILMYYFGSDVKDTIPISALISCSLFPTLKEFFSGNHKHKVCLTLGGWFIVIAYIGLIYFSTLSRTWLIFMTLGFFYGVLLAACGTIYGKK